MLKPYYTQGTRSIIAENVILQALSFEKQAEYLTARTLADVALFPVIAPERWMEHNGRVNRQFDLIYGMKFNQHISLDVVESRTQFAELAKRALDAGMIGPAPRNLRPDLKISFEEANRRRAEGETIPEWYVRSAEEEKIVAKMIADWKRYKGDIT